MLKRKYRFVFIAIAVVAVIGVAFACYISINKERLIYDYMLYDHIQYNRHDYYRAENQYYPSNEGEERGPVYIVDESSKVYYKYSYKAFVNTGYAGEDEEIYLFFDSVMWIRDGYSTVKSAGAYG